MASNDISDGRMPEKSQNKCTKVFDIAIKWSTKFGIIIDERKRNSNRKPMQTRIMFELENEMLCYAL